MGTSMDTLTGKIYSRAKVRKTSRTVVLYPQCGVLHWYVPASKKELLYLSFSLLFVFLTSQNENVNCRKLGSKIKSGIILTI